MTDTTSNAATRHFATVAGGALMSLQSIVVKNDASVAIARQVEAAEYSQLVNPFFHVEADREYRDPAELYELDRDMSGEMIDDPARDGATIREVGRLLGYFVSVDTQDSSVSRVHEARAEIAYVRLQDEDLAARIEAGYLLEGDLTDIDDILAGKHAADLAA